MMRWWLKVRAVRRQILCLWLLLLGLALVAALGFLDLAASDPDGTLPSKDKHPHRRAFVRLPPEEETRPDMEVIVDSRDPAADLDVALSPIASLQEDELLLFVASSAQGLSKTPRTRRRGASYKMLMRGKIGDADQGMLIRPTTTTQQLGDSKGVQEYGFNEQVNEQMIVSRHTLPEMRHPA